MTPLKPIEELTVKGAHHGPEQYKLPEICQHPECTEKATNQHELWPKSMLKGKFWWVCLPDDPMFLRPVPNVVHLCGSGTSGHHGDVEEHRAWIKLEDGVFVWYDRIPIFYPDGSVRPGDDTDGWEKLGPLNPQPGQVVGKPKRKRFKGEARRTRKTVTWRVPNDAGEDGAALLDEQLELAGEKLIAQGLYQDAPPPYYITMAALIFFNSHVGFDA